jgi:hypothetical protein
MRGGGGGFILFSRGRADINRIGHEARGRERTIWGFFILTIYSKVRHNIPSEKVLEDKKYKKGPNKQRTFFFCNCFKLLFPVQ